MVLAVAAGVVNATVGGGVFPFDNAGEGIKLGVLVALVAPLGDLSESLVGATSTSRTWGAFSRDTVACSTASTPCCSCSCGLVPGQGFRLLPDLNAVPRSLGQCL